MAAATGQPQPEYAPGGLWLEICRASLYCQSLPILHTCARTSPAPGSPQVAKATRQALKQQSSRKHALRALRVQLDPPLLETGMGLAIAGALGHAALCAAVLGCGMIYHALMRCVFMETGLAWG